MKRYSFGTFEVEEGNRQAHEICRAVADLEQVLPLPVLLLGDPRCGKTHLLYSVVNRVRGASSKTGLAYVTAHDFPEQVRSLIDDPSPLQRAHSAILLVDQLELFTEYVEELEAVVRIFLDHHHYVVLASNVHPERLTNLTDGLVEIINSGQIASVSPRAAQAAPGPSPEQDKLVAQQREEIRQLRERLAEQKALAVDPGELAALREQLDTASAENKALQDDLADLQKQAQALKKETDSQKLLAALPEEPGEAEALEEAKAAADQDAVELREQVALLEAAREAAQEKIAELEAALEDKAGVEEEAEELRQRVVDIKAEAEAAADRAMQLHAVLADKAALETEVHRLRKGLEAAQNEGAVARNEANELVKRAETLLEQVESNRARFAQTEQQYQDQIRQLEARLVEMDQVRARAEELDELKAELDQTRAEAGAVRADAEAMREHFGELREEFAQTKDSFDTELSVARTEAARAVEARDEAVRKQQELAAACDEALAERDQLAEARDHIQAKHDALAGTLERAQAESASVREEAQAQQEQLRTSLEAALEEAESRYVNIELEMGKLREDLDAQTAELDVLRRESAERVAAAEARAEQAEDQAHETASVVGAELDGMRQRLIETTEALAKLASRLSESTALKVEGPAPAPQTDEAEGPHAPDQPEAESVPGDALDEERLPDVDIIFPEPEQ